MLFNDEAFVDYVGEHFVGVAASDVFYNGLDGDGKGRGEFRFLRDSLRDGGKSIHQGVYAVTSSGKYLGKIDTGWPSYDAKKSLVNLKKAVSAYEAMNKAKRLGKALGESERSFEPREGEFRPELMKMVGSARYYDFAGMVLFDQRHPVYSKRDSVWFTKSEARSMVPEKLEAGAEGVVGAAVVRRLLLKSQFQFGCSAWWEEHIKESSLRVKVLNVKGDQVQLAYSGKFFMDADSKWNQSSFRNEVLGRGVWNSSTGEFESLELVSLGNVKLAELKRNMHRGDTKETRVAAYLRLAKAGREREMVPHSWDEYPRDMRGR